MALIHRQSGGGADFQRSRVQRMSLRGLQALEMLFGDDRLDAALGQKVRAEETNGPSAHDQNRGFDLVHRGPHADFGGMVRPNVAGMFGPHWLTAPMSIE